MLALVELGRLAGDAFEILVKTGEVVEAAFVTQLFDADAVVEQQFAGMADAQLGEELGVGLAGAGFEIAAEGVRHQLGYGGHFFEIDFAGKMTEGIVVDGVDPVVLRFGEIGAETYGREELQMRRGGEGRETFDEGDNAAHPFGGLDMPKELRHPFFLARAHENTPAGFFQQVADGFCLGQIEKGIAPEIFGEMDHGRVNGPAAVLIEIDVVVSPVVRQVAAYEDDVAGLEAFDMVAHELGAAALVEDDELHLDMIVPAVVDEWIPVFPHAERLGRGPGDF